MPDPRCPYCRRRYADVRGCKPGLPGEIDPVLYGDEWYPFSDEPGPTCRDCGAPKGLIHHADCSCSECPSCHRQYHGGMTCEEDAQFHAELRSGGTAA